MSKKDSIDPNKLVETAAIVAKFMAHLKENGFTIIKYNFDQKEIDAILSSFLIKEGTIDE